MAVLTPGAATDTAYGVDLSPSRLVVVRARRARRGPVLETVFCGKPDAGAGDAAALAAVRRHGDAGGAVAAEMPAGRAFARWLQTPFASRSKTARVLPSVLDIQLPFPVESCVCAFPMLEKNDAGAFRALALAARCEDVERRLRDFHTCGLDPTVLDHEAMAAWHYGAALYPPSGERYRVFMALDEDRCTLVMGEGETFQSVHSLTPRPTPGNATEPLDIVPRVQRILRAQCTGPDAAIAWVWTGAAAADPPRLAPVEQALKREHRVSFRTAEQPHTFLARALAVRALAPDRAVWDLRRDALEHPGMARARDRQGRRNAVAALVAGLLLIATNLGWNAVLNRRNRDVRRQVTERAAGLTGLPATAIPPGQEVFVVQQHLATGTSGGNPVTRAFAPGASDALFQAAQSASRAPLSVQEFAVTEGLFHVRGAGPDWASCLAFREDLAGKGFDVSIEKSTHTSPDIVGFTLKGTLRRGR